MALGLIQFLLGGKTKKKESKTTTAVPVNSVQNQQINSQNQIPSSTSVTNQGQNNVVQDNQNTTSSPSQTNINTTTNNSANNPSNKKSVSEVLMKMHKEMKETNERLTGLVTDIKKLENSVSSLNNRVDNIDKKERENESKFKEIDSNMAQFLSLYELINNQYNPFVSKEETFKVQEESTPLNIENEQESMVEPIEISPLNDNGNGVSLEMKPQNDEFKFDTANTDSEKLFKEEIKIDNKSPLNELKINNSHKEEEISNIEQKEKSSKISQSLLELDTLNIEAAAADAVPLTMLKNNTNALVIILSWMEYLIKKVGIEETRNTLRYYTETLRWMTPEVFFELDKYLRGMSDVKSPLRHKTNVKDHIVSLYFISKLNEKSLDHKLTTAVLEIIQE